MYAYFLIIMLIFIAIMIYFILFKRSLPKVYEYNNDNIHNTHNTHNANNYISLLIISGVHGNERAGPYTLNKLIKSNYFEQIIKNINLKKFIKKIYVIPIVNEFGYKYNLRYQNDLFNPDINRNFYKNVAGPKDLIAKFIDNYIKKSDIIIDFHEGHDFHLINNKSIGSTIKTNNQSLLIFNILNNLNSLIYNPDKKFILLTTSPCDIDHTLGCYIYKYYPNKNYILIETTGQNEIQPIYIREKQIMIILDTIFSFDFSQKRQ